MKQWIEQIAKDPDCFELLPNDKQRPATGFLKENMKNAPIKINEELLNEVKKVVYTIKISGQKQTIQAWIESAISEKLKSSKK